MKTIVAATRNEHKIKEIEAITKQFGMSIISRDEAGVPKIEIPEDGDTFEENSRLKAVGIMKLCNEITIADDSGLEVDCLGGAPGVYSARFAAFAGLRPEDGEQDSPDTNDDDNNKKVMRLIKDKPFEECTARFVSVITMAFPDGREISVRGEVEGHVIPEERGGGGFGYDPMFIPLGYDKTFGELGQDIKNQLSHRAKALTALSEKLKDMKDIIE